MSVKLRKINEQVIVITGATSGIGLTTARMAAEAGAKLVLVARNGDALDQLASELRRHGSQVATVAADVGNAGDIERVGQTALERFGRIDTWVNNAGVGTFGRLEEVALEDHMRLFQTNFWGVVNGSLEAVKRMKGRGGGALINVGSEVSDRAAPLQGMYSASKHAVKAFTDSLRMELEKEAAPISVTLVKPAGIDTLFAVHAKNYMDKEAALPPPVYAPEVVAKAILYCAQHPKRDIFVGGASKMISAGNAYMPRMLDKFMNASMWRQQKSKFDKLPGRPDALHAPDPAQTLRERQGMTERHVFERSAYTATALRSKPLMAILLGGGALLAAWGLARPATGRRQALADLTGTGLARRRFAR
ncbi:SDR family oxidoreductase [Massilia sp. Dwa41.01b]|uniref:SDR family oxidoreductase n=1 Tax=unclassified Massilia TaxID=2609279 RepID=UPI001600A2C8|nr:MULTISPECIES: SDR family oxidoreductase [unclassified Massilia]QNA88545.1 SDR family oxidoreductase [Massilia sp. Dwa41.01b]QNA99443.1 SDR family oxidoreductase [Massilia sp. Se16.2.3]